MNVTCKFKIILILTYTLAILILDKNSTDQEIKQINLHLKNSHHNQLMGREKVIMN